MKLEKQENKIDSNQKEKLRSIFDNNLSFDIEKNYINTEQYKNIKKEIPVVEKNNPIKFSSIRKPVEQINKTFNDNVKNFYNIINNSNYYKNLSNFITNKKDNLSNKFYTLTSIKKEDNKNIDFKNMFLPSNEINEQIQKVFYKTDLKNNVENLKNNFSNTTINNSVNKINQTKVIPALQEGGVVKEPTVAYLHKNEAVIPLKGSDKFNEFINTITKETVKTISKNESTKNLTEIRNSTTTNNNNKMSQQKTMQTTNNISEPNMINNSPIVINDPPKSNATDTGSGSLGAIYSGSVSREAFFMNTYKLPSWRTKLG